MMKIRFSRSRTFLLTLTVGFAAVCIGNRLMDYINEIQVDLPEVKSETPIMIRVCREPGSDKEYREKGYQYFSNEKAMLCTLSVGDGGGGATYEK